MRIELMEGSQTTDKEEVNEISRKQATKDTQQTKQGKIKGKEKMDDE